MTWDVVETNEDVMVRFIASGYLQPYTPASAANYRDNLKDPKNLWVTDRVNAQTPSLNTNLVKADEYPKAWDDLAQPTWKGRLAIEHQHRAVRPSASRQLPHPCPRRSRGWREHRQ